jgi:hypothetical protein
LAEHRWEYHEFLKASAINRYLNRGIEVVFFFVHKLLIINIYFVFFCFLHKTRGQWRI